MSFLINLVRYPIEGFLFFLVIFVGHFLTARANSNFGGWLLRTVLPIMPVNRVARRNLSYVFPKLSPLEQNLLIRRMWDNFGRTFLEYIRLPRLKPFGPKSLVEIEGIDHIDRVIQSGKPAILVTAHLGNWDVGTYVAIKRGLDVAHVQRQLNNPLSDRLIQWVQRRYVSDIIHKGPASPKRILTALRRKTSIVMLMDQKMNTGVPVPFFGKDAMTAPLVARLALKYKIPIIPFQVIRLADRCRHQVRFYDPIKVPRGVDDETATLEILKKINSHIESWILEHPDQWFWVHRRWPKEFYQKDALSTTVASV